MKTSKVNYKKIQKLQEFRIDADYYMPEYLELESILKNSDTIEILCKTQDLQSNGAFKDIYNILNDGNEKVIPYIRSGNVGDFFVNKNDLEYISKEAHNQLIKTQTKIDDVLMARKGKIGGATIITPNSINFNSNDNVVNIKVKNNKYLNAAYLVTFLNSKYGYKQIERQATGNVQPWLSMYQVRNIKIVVKRYNFQLFIEKLLKKAYIITTESENLYKISENLILKNLNLLNWQPKHELSYVKNFSDVNLANRYDAEYFQPKYDEILEKVKLYKNGYTELGKIGIFTSGSFIPDCHYSSSLGTAYIRIKELSLEKPINKDDVIYINNKFIEKNETKVLSKDYVIATIGNTIGKVNLINDDFTNSFISNNTTRYRLKNKNNFPYYMEILLRSMVVQTQIEREYTQTAQPKISNNSLEKIIIPDIKDVIKAQINKDCKKSHMYYEQSKQLLEIAKRGVEIAIEENEDIATKWINEQLLKLGITI